MGWKMADVPGDPLDACQAGMRLSIDFLLVPVTIYSGRAASPSLAKLAQVKHDQLECRSGREKQNARG